MEEAVRARTAAREAIRDVEPDRLRDDMDRLLTEASMVPGALASLSADAVDGSVDPEAVSERAAGVQLIYEGLRLTRTLAREEPWTDAPDHTDPNVDILAADVLVSRGFYLLARTEAADRAVETVRAFGRDQTRRRERGADAADLDATLEENVLELAVVAGASAVAPEHRPALVEYAGDLARSLPAPMPDAETALAGAAADLDRATARRDSGPSDEHVRPSATDP